MPDKTSNDVSAAAPAAPARPATGAARAAREVIAPASFTPVRPLPPGASPRPTQARAPAAPAAAVAGPMPAPADAAAEPSKPQARAWDDAPAHTKGTLLILLALTAGLLIARLDDLAGHRPWLVPGGIVAASAGLLWLGRRWFWAPLEALAREVEQLGQDARPIGLTRLPVDRRDDVGVIARAVQRLATHSLRHHHEAHNLRRTLDHRVAQATRVATLQLRQQALRDPLTDLGNRRFLDEQLDPLLHSHRAAGADLACVLIDLDNFKAVNDTLGHGGGDELLLFVSGLIRACSRQEDHTVRLGGDEFVVLMPGCDIEGAERFARQVLAHFRRHARTALPPQLGAGLSIGLASLGNDGPADGNQLLERADARLYEAKRSGKDRVLA